MATALHNAVYRNDVQAVRRLLEDDIDVNFVDAESGWSPLHKALYWGHLRIAALLLHKGASTYVSDKRGRTPLELVAEELKSHLPFSTPGGVFAWGSGTNYQLGTASTEHALAPVRVDALQNESIVALSAAKFHSAALTEGGQLFTWGWGRGGRLGHPDFEDDSTEKILALILPRAVDALARKHVTGVAAAKHHTVACTSDGCVYTWGHNSHGQLGMGTVGSTELIPRQVSALRTVIVAVSAANRHTVALSSGGTVYTWGGNGEGQLGYSTRGAACSVTPRSVDAIKDRRIVAISAAKRHTVVLSSEGDVLTWGHRVSTPVKLQLHGCRDTARSEKALKVLQVANTRGSAPPAASGRSTAAQLHFHRDHAAVARPRIVAVAAGASHTSMLTSAGVVLAYRSADPEFRVQEVVGALSGKCVVRISAGKTRTVAVTDTGEVYAWEAEHEAGAPRKVVSLAVQCCREVMLHDMHLH